MLDDRTIETLARAYHTAEKERRRTRAPTVLHPGFTVEDAYAVQRKWIEIKVAEGNVVKGHKIGLTSRAMQRQANIEEPDYGSLMADMFYQDGSQLPMSRFIQPRLECELGFVMGKRLKGPNCTIFDVLNATDYIIPAAEIVDGRTHRLTRKPSSRAACWTASRTMRAMPRWWSADGRCGRWTSICAGSPCCATATASSRNPASRRRC